MRPEWKTDEQIAQAGLAAMESYMRELGLVLNGRELGVDETMLDGIAQGSFILEGGYKAVSYTHLDVYQRQLQKSSSA